jgi:hypothetical protein
MQGGGGLLYMTVLRPTTTRQIACLGVAQQGMDF